MVRRRHSKQTNMTQQMRYGTNVPGAPRYNDGTWERIDTYTSKDTGNTAMERRFCAGPLDDSPVANDSRNLGLTEGNNIRYDSKCSCCFLGFSHTTFHHNQSIK